MATDTLASRQASAFSLKDFLTSFMLLELFKGLRVTGKYFFSRKITVQFPEEKTPLSPRFRGAGALGTANAASPQAVRAVCPALAIITSRASSARTALVAPPAIHRPRHSLRALRRESCPVDSDVAHVLNTTAKARRPDFTKDMLLAVGDRYEARSPPIARAPAFSRNRSLKNHGRPDRSLLSLLAGAVRGLPVITARNLCMRRCSPGIQARRRGCCCAPSSTISGWCTWAPWMVLFLFVVMMLDIDIARAGFWRHGRRHHGRRIS
jgi:NADH-quinone oxidoreductase subunit I